MGNKGNIFKTSGGMSWIGSDGSGNFVSLEDEHFPIG